MYRGYVQADETLLSWLAWTCDAFDFFSVSLSVNTLSKQFDRPTKQIVSVSRPSGTPSPGHVLMRTDDCDHPDAVVQVRRSGEWTGSPHVMLPHMTQVVFGILSDRFGRKWPLVVNLIFCCVIEIATSFVQTFEQFLAVRALFGVAMGGIWGLAASTALENLPVGLRGLGSGIVQQGYAAGYLFASVINITVVPRTSHSWRALFWTAACLSSSTAVLRALTPESAVFLRAKALERARGTQHNTTEKTRVFVRETKAMLRSHWKLCIYAVLLMTGASRVRLWGRSHVD